MRTIDELVDEVCQRSTSLRGRVHDVVEAQVDALAPLATPLERDALITRSVARLDGLGVLDQYARDEEVDEILVNDGRDVYVERDGRLEHVAQLPAGAIDVILERVLAPLGRRLDRTSPIVDARLPDGSRLCAVVAPIAVDGTIVAIRRHRRRPVALERFASPDVGELLAEIVSARANVLVTGATSSGKTTLLAALCRTTADDDRLVIVEDTTEIELGDRHAVRLEARRATSDGPEAVDPTVLVRAALRLRPDRLVVGEFRGPEVLAVVQALNTGHDGSLSTCHANGPVDGLHRMETLVMQAAPSWPLEAIRHDISRSVDVVIHVERRPGGARTISEIVEVAPSGGEPTGRRLAHGARVVGELSRSRR